MACMSRFVDAAVTIAVVDDDNDVDDGEVADAALLKVDSITRSVRAALKPGWRWMLDEDA